MVTPPTGANRPLLAARPLGAADPLRPPALRRETAAGAAVGRRRAARDGARFRQGRQDSNLRRAGLESAALAGLSYTPWCGFTLPGAGVCAHPGYAPPGGCQTDSFLMNFRSLAQRS